MADIKLTVRSNFSKAAADIKSFGETTEREAKRIERFKSKFKGSEIDNFIQKNQRAAAAVLATRGPLEAAAAKQAGLRREAEKLIRNGIDPQDQALKRLRREYSRATRDLDAHRMAQQFNAQAVRGATIALGALGAATAVVGARGVKAYSDYSKSLANVNTLLPISRDEMDALDTKMSELSTRFATQKTELAGGVYQALSAGAADLGEALEIVEASAKLGRGALIDNATAVDIVTTAMNAYGKETVSAQKAIDIYFTTVKQGKITGEQLSQTIGQSISLFASAKIPIEELSAGIATLTKTGVPASEATTQLNAIVNSFLKPSAALSAGLKKVGFESGAAFLEAKGLGGAIRFLDTSTGGAIDEIAKLVPNVRALRGTLGAGIEEGKEFSTILEAFSESAGAADEAMRVQTEGVAKGAFTMEQAKVALRNLSILLGEKFLPPLAAAAQKVTEFVGNSERLRRTMNILLPILGGVAGSLAGFIVVSKLISIIKGLSAAMGALNIVMRANPAALIATAIGLVVTGIIVLYRNWDKVVVFMQTTALRLRERFAQVGSALKLGWVVAINAIKIAFIELGGLIAGKVLAVVENLLNTLAKIPGIGAKFAGLSADVAAFRTSLDDAKIAAIEKSRAVIEGARAEREEIIKSTDAQIAAIQAGAQAREAASGGSAGLGGIPPDVAALAGGATMTPALAGGSAEPSATIPGAVADTGIIASEQAQFAERLAGYDEFFGQRSEMEAMDFEQRAAFLDEQRELILASDALTHQMQFDALVEIRERELALEKEVAAAKKALMEQSLQVTGDILGSIGSIIESLGNKSRESVIAQKALSAVQAAINSYLAFTNVLATPLPFPLNVLAATAVLAAGIAQQVKILSTPVPSAEIGGRFAVPANPASGRGDSRLLRVNPGEQVDVIPRGEGLGNSIRVVVQLDRQPVIDIVRSAIATGDLFIATDDNVKEEEEKEEAIDAL